MRMNRLQIVGAFFLIVALGFAALGGVVTMKAQAGLDSLDAVYAEQNVTLSYNDEGQLIDRGKTEIADEILELLVDVWKFPVDYSDFDPNDPLVNTPTELMYQAATVTTHVLNGTQTIVLTEDVEYKGVMYEAGEYEFAIDGRYWTDFDRKHPLEGPARAKAWPGAFGVLNGIYAGTVADNVAGLAHALGLFIMLGLGGAFGLSGAGLIWASKEDE